MGQDASVAIKKLADALTTKRNKSYSRVAGWMRCYLAFSLARSAICCVRGSRSTSRAGSIARFQLTWSRQRHKLNWHRFHLLPTQYVFILPLSCISSQLYFSLFLYFITGFFWIYAFDPLTQNTISTYKIYP